jgi:hypothetical protein
MKRGAHGISWGYSVDSGRSRRYRHAVSTSMVPPPGWLTFRIVNSQNFYVFGASTDGYCRLWKRADGLWVPLTAETDVSALVSDSGWNHL